MSAQLESLACFHCGLPNPPASVWQVQIDGVQRPMCCPGCAAVAQGIIESGFGDYYSNRTEFAGRADGDPVLPAQLALYDAEPALAEPHAGQDACAAVFSVEGIRCAACVWLIERRLARLPGVLRAEMNVATERLHLRWSPDLCKPSAILQALATIGYAAYPFEAARHGVAREQARKTLFRQTFIAGLAMMQVMMYALPAYIAEDGTLDAEMDNLMRWASLLLTAPAVLYSARPFFAGAWHSLRQGMPGMDVPVALGIAAAAAASVVATLRGHGEVYFDSVTMFIFLLLASRYLELLARTKAGRALERLQHGLPASARRMPGFPQQREFELVGAAQLEAGQVILVGPGEALAADAVIVEGDTEIDLALLTGESMPRRHGVGDEVPGGAVNASQPIVLRVLRGARESTLARLVELVERAGHGKPQLAMWADRVAAWFVLALLLLTVLVFVAWQMSEPERAWQVAIAVLVVSCPCALSLATPSALAAATDALVGRGILIVKPHVLETLERATHVVFDKTGTLTQGRPVLRQVIALGPVEHTRCLELAAALEAASSHPLGMAIRAAAPHSKLVAQQLRSTPGQGVEGMIGGRWYRLGQAAFAYGGALDTRGLHSEVYLGSDAGLLARFEIADALRPDAGALIEQIKRRGQQVILLSGDAQQVVSRVAAELGIANALGRQLPADKLAYVQHLQAQGAVVAMVGDGINDAAVLSGADVSFAMGGGAVLAQMHADCVLLSGRLASFGQAQVVAARALGVVRQNLAWATLYNVVAIPAAAFGYLDPWMAAAGMSASSAVVVLNALRLRRTGA